jgi:hypothetical protein
MFIYHFSKVCSQIVQPQKVDSCVISISVSVMLVCHVCMCHCVISISVSVNVDVESCGLL